MEFYTKISPVFNGKKELIPPPNLCPECRQQRRLSFRNERKLYRRKCSMTHKDIISVYSPEASFPVYVPSVWFGDAWDALSYGRDVNFSASFSAQFRSIQTNIPHVSLLNLGCENCEYNHGLIASKNCYYCFSNNNLEDTQYTQASMGIRDSLDCWWSKNIHYSYECPNSDNLYHCMYCTGCSQDRDCFWCEDCIECQDCFLSYGLVHAKYCIMNREYPPEEYKSIVARALGG